MHGIKVCPHCGKEYDGLEEYCSKCGYKLEKSPNKCSEMKTAMCEHRVLADDDLFCPYCGSPSTYSLKK